MSLRGVRRAALLAETLLFILVRLSWMRMRGPLTAQQRVQWFQSACRAVLRSLGVECLVLGHPPGRGMIVSNHLGYLDILVYGAAVPCILVSKAEVGAWPFFGFAARAAGTIFIDRSTRSGAAEATWQIEHSLSQAMTVLVFPEGTSSDGDSVLPFHPALFEAAVRMREPVTPAAVSFTLAGDGQERDLCWFGEAKFLSHLWRVLCGPSFLATVQFGSCRMYADRRIAADTTHAEVCRLRGQPVRDLCAMR